MCGEPRVLSGGGWHPLGNLLEWNPLHFPAIRRSGTGGEYGAASSSADPALVDSARPGRGRHAPPGPAAGPSALTYALIMGEE